jgi:hypothetical protein
MSIIKTEHATSHIDYIIQNDAELHNKSLAMLSKGDLFGFQLLVRKLCIETELNYRDVDYRVLADNITK